MLVLDTDLTNYLSIGGRYNYVPMPDRQELALPDDKRLAFWIGLNIECWRRDLGGPAIERPAKPYDPDPMNQGWAEYGPRVGTWRIMEGLDSLGLRASVLLNSDVCEVYPRIIEEGNKRNWVWLAHGKNNSRRQGDLDPGEEPTYLKEMVNAIVAGTGKQPRGWLGPGLSETYETPDLLAELGIEYVCDWCNDDVPYPIDVKSGRMISVPYSIELNDVVLCLGKRFSGTQIQQAIEDQFNALYAEASRKGARVMCLALHPYLIGQPLYFGYLMKALEYITDHQDVWATTSDDVANWYYESTR